MYRIIIGIMFFATLSTVQVVSAQEGGEKQSNLVQKRKNRIIQEEKELLKVEVSDINNRLNKKEITETESLELKEKAAKKRALNIQDRIAILEGEVALLQRNAVDTLDIESKNSLSSDLKEYYSWLTERVTPMMDGETDDRETLKYDRRTFSDPVLTFGFNMASIDGSFDDSPYINFGAMFWELGWSWRTRVFDNSNFLRFHYGLSLQINPLTFRYNEYYALTEGQPSLQEFEFPLRDAVFKRTNLVVPMFLEFGPSKVSKTENSIRYSLKNQVRVGFGVFAGLNLNTKQKLKYIDNGERVKIKQKNDFNTERFIYGLSAYAGFDGVLLYVKYDLNPIFKDAELEQRNFSIGFRFDL